MSVFIQQLNLITGGHEWNPQREDYDYKQEVARSSFADMLHDNDRNEKYFEGLRMCIRILRNQGKEIHVLDIGTGTSLLSMMALSLDVDSVTACETFTPMAECALKILKTNGFEDKIRLIGKRSTEMEVGPDKDMPRRANLLVTEVFDTELIGEGAIETFRHAKEHLLTDDAFVVPCEGTIYGQVVSSKLFKDWNKMSSIVCSKSKKMLLDVPSDILNCFGVAAVHDFQMSEIPVDSFIPLSEPIPIFQFDWTGRKIPLENNRISMNEFSALNSGNCDALLMWWDLTMDPSREVILSCAPIWDHPITKGKEDSESSMIPWRDHWMQAAYYFPQSVKVQEGETVSLASSHDEYSLWFNLNTSKELSEKPFCDCGLHILCSRTRIGQMNDPRRKEFYVNLLEKHINSESICLMLGTFSYLGIVAAKLGAKHVYLHEPNKMSARILENFIRFNGVENRVTIFTRDLSDVTLSQLNFTPATLVFSEPNFSTSLLPWHSLQFLYLMKSGRHLIAANATILPSRMSILGIPVQFRDLWKIRAPLGECSGFNMTHFDDLIDTASDEADENVEPQPLWEYPTEALGSPKTLLTIPLDKEIPSAIISQITDLPVQLGTLNGMAFWVDWHFGSTDETTLTTGPIKPPDLGNNIAWDMNTRQGISLLKQRKEKIHHENLVVQTQLKFRPDLGSITFNINVIS